MKLRGHEDPRYLRMSESDQKMGKIEFVIRCMI